MATRTTVPDEEIRRYIRNNLNPKPNWNLLHDSLENWRYSTPRNNGIPIEMNWRNYDPDREASRAYLYPGYSVKDPQMKAAIADNYEYQLKIASSQIAGDPKALELVEHEIMTAECPEFWLNRAHIWAKYAILYEQFEADTAEYHARWHEAAQKQRERQKKPEKSSMRNFTALRPNLRRVKFDTEIPTTPRTAGGGIYGREVWPETQEEAVLRREQERRVWEQRQAAMRKSTGMFYHWKDQDVNMVGVEEDGGRDVDSDVEMEDEERGLGQRRQRAGRPDLNINVPPTGESQEEEDFDEFYDVTPPRTSERDAEEQRQQAEWIHEAERKEAEEQRQKRKRQPQPPFPESPGTQQHNAGERRRAAESVHGAEVRTAEEQRQQRQQQQREQPPPPPSARRDSRKPFISSENTIWTSDPVSQPYTETAEDWQGFGRPEDKKNVRDKDNVMEKATPTRPNFVERRPAPVDPENALPKKLNVPPMPPASAPSGPPNRRFVSSENTVWASSPHFQPLAENTEDRQGFGAPHDKSKVRSGDVLENATPTEPNMPAGPARSKDATPTRSNMPSTPAAPAKKTR